MYEAVSYIWGNWKDGKAIQVDGTERYPVTHNLFLALRGLRRTDVKRRLWADQICIDQQNVPSSIAVRIQEVFHMDRIFGSRTCQVLVWLGDTASSKMDGAVLKKMIKSNRKLVNSLWW